jgi:hypothetical protein
MSIMSMLMLSYQFYEFTTKFWLGRWHDEDVGIFALCIISGTAQFFARRHETLWGFPVFLLGELDTFSSLFTKQFPLSLKEKPFFP